MKKLDKHVQQGIDAVNAVFHLYIKKFELSSFMSEEDLEDMKQEGMLEMLRGIPRFDPDRKIQFDSFISPRIKGFFINHLQKQGLLRKIHSERVVDFLSEEIENVFQTEETDDLLDRLNLYSDDIRNMVLSLSEDELMSDIQHSLCTLPEIKLKIVISYYVFNKSIKEISKELGYEESSGWVYKMKKQAINMLKKQLKLKGMYIP